MTIETSAQDSRVASDARYARYPSLADRAVLITGGATGIGAAFVEHFARQGARVAFVDLDAQAGQALAESLAQLPEVRHAPLFLPCDLTDIDALRHAIDAIRARIGAIAVLVNNAATTRATRSPK